jgi:hypothetical protein
MQIAGFKWKKDSGQWQPYLLVGSGSVERVPLWAAPLSITVGEKFCTGHFSGGTWSPCPDMAKTLSMVCDGCKAKDDFYLCIECDGSDCKNHKQRPSCEKEGYVMYLASFDTLLKVGISRDARFYERLIEQGADFGTKIAAVKDGQYVRKMEQIISKYLGCPDRISGEVKQSLLFGDPNASTIQVVKAIARLKDAHWDFPIQPEIYDFRRYYRLSEIKAMPKKLAIESGTQLKGRVAATKGNIVVMRNSEGTFSFDARRIVGREIVSIKCESLAGATI